MDTKTKESLNRFLTECIDGCQHEWGKIVDPLFSLYANITTTRCKKCGKLQEKNNIEWKED